MCSYRSCFVPGVPDKPQVYAVAAFPTAFDVSSPIDVSNVPGVPVVAGVPAIVGVPYCCRLPAVGFPAFASVPALDKVSAVAGKNKTF